MEIAEDLKRQFRERFGKVYDWKEEALSIFDMSKGIDHYLDIDRDEGGKPSFKEVK